MNQAEGVRYKQRVRLVSALAFIVSSVVGINVQLKAILSAGNQALSGGAANSASDFTNLLTASIVVFPITLLGTWLLYRVLSFVYLRNPGYMLEEGYYSDSSWLNLKGNQIVFLEPKALVVANFDKVQADIIDKEYQHNSGFDNLDYLENRATIQRLPYNRIEKLATQRGDNCIDIVSNGKTHQLTFVNSGTKTHALGYLCARLPKAMQSNETRSSEWRTAAPQLLAFAFFVVCAVFTYHGTVSIILGAPAAFLVPGILESVFDPATLSEWSSGGPDSVEESVSIDEMDTSMNNHAIDSPNEGEQVDSSGAAATRRAA